MSLAIPVIFYLIHGYYSYFTMQKYIENTKLSLKQSGNINRSREKIKKYF